MPTYEYRCRDCSHEFELFQRMSDEPRASCPRCGGPAERLLSAGAGLLFKGDGFYITDYRSDAYRKKAEQEAPSSGKASAGASDGSSPKKDGASPPSSDSSGSSTSSGSSGSSKSSGSGSGGDA